MKIDFVIASPLLVTHCSPIVNALNRRGEDAVFVAPPQHGVLTTVDRAGKRALHLACVEALKRAAVPFCVAPRLDADVAITTQGSNVLHLYQGHKLKLRYGVGLYRRGLHYNAAMCQGFDGLLAHGSFERKVFSRWFSQERISVMGIPRHDPWFAQPIGKAEARQRLSISPGEERAVVAYFPTWAEHSSLESFGEGLALLAEKYVLLVKPHALSELSAREHRLLHRLAHLGARVLSADYDFPTVVCAADLIIADAKSGATPEAALLACETPFVSLTQHETSDFFDELGLAGPCVRDGAALSSTVEAALRSDEFLSSRRRLKVELFSDNQGRASEDAAEAILHLASIPKISGSPSWLEQRCSALFRVVRGRRAALATRFARPIRAHDPSV